MSLTLIRACLARVRSNVPFRLTGDEEQTFDVRLSLNAAVMADTRETSSLSGTEAFERRRVKGCPALQTKAYKNLLAGG